MSMPVDRVPAPERPPDWAALRAAVTAIAHDFAADRHDRQRRRKLDEADFHRLADAGFLLTAVPAEHGGLFESAEASVRPIAELLRVLATGDASVALVASMHVTVPFVCGWLAGHAPPAEVADAWEAQRRFVSQTALEGHWWGTIASEPGTGGDMAKTRSAAQPVPEGGYRLTGTKHFGSGSGVMSYMMTAARPDGEAEPDVFVLDVRDGDWDGSNGVRLLSEWDGHGMIATQSHAFAFEGVPAERVAWPHPLDRGTIRTVGYVASMFAAVIVGVLDAAVTGARAQLVRRGGGLGSFERAEFVHAHNEAWAAAQALEGMIRTVEEGGGRATLTGKMVVAELAESATGRLGRLLGGGTYARHSPFGFWAQDVRALGFLRPPWAVMQRMLEEALLAAPEEPAEA